MKLSDTTSINLPTLLESRLLVQANSGGGKSWALRRLLEQTAPHVQQLVIDPEGEFSTLREKFDYVIAAPHDGDAVATPKTAALLARRLLESGVSAILDIFDLKAHERQQFVKRFLDALINAPRALWHPVMVVVDEAHTFAPQSGSAEALSSVIDLATRGRKRGQCLVLATQRLSKLHKDAAAEMLNKLIGRTGLDVDVKRAADELGFTPRDAMEMLRNLSPGEFYAFGPALTPIVTKLRIGQVQTTHPKAGDRLMRAPPAPSKRVLASLAKLEDLQKEADVEAATVEQLQAQATDLRRKLTIAERKATAAGVPETEVQQRIAAAVKSAAAAGNKSGNNLSSELHKILRTVGDHASKIQTALSSLPATASNPSTTIRVTVNAPRSLQPAPAAGPVSDGVNAAQQKILDVLAQLEAFGIQAADKSMVAAHAGVSPTSGGYFNNLGRLRANGLVDYPAGGTVALTDGGRAIANKPTKAPTLEDLHNSWFRILPQPQATLLALAIGIYPNSLTKDDLADLAGVSRTSGGYFNNLGKLRTLGAIDYPQKGMVRATDLLFPAVK
jgi:hypothetical protein